MGFRKPIRRSTLADAVKKRLAIDALLYTLPVLMSVTLFEKLPLQQAFTGRDSRSDSITVNKQLLLLAC
jgi:hypothetical protein